jgi:protein phosphatase
VQLNIPGNSLVVLVGPSGAGKSTFAAKHFRATEIVSSDRCRALVADRENDLRATPAAFRVLHAIATERLQAGRLTVIDATSVLAAARQPLIDLARKHRRPAVAIVFDLPLETCLERNSRRPERRLAKRVVERQHDQMKRSIESLESEGFERIVLMSSVEAVETAVIVREVAANP